MNSRWINSNSSSSSSSSNWLLTLTERILRDVRQSHARNFLSGCEKRKGFARGCESLGSPRLCAGSFVCGRSDGHGWSRRMNPRARDARQQLKFDVDVDASAASPPLHVPSTSTPSICSPSLPPLRCSLFTIHYSLFTVHCSRNGPQESKRLLHTQEANSSISATPRSEAVDRENGGDERVPFAFCDLPFPIAAHHINIKERMDRASENRCRLTPALPSFIKRTSKDQ